MKKLIVGLLMAFLTASGLVAATNTSAIAADCPYEGCVDTTTTATITVNNGANKATIKVKVKPVGSNARAIGKVRVAVKKKGTSKVVYDVTKAYNTTGQVSFTTGKLKPGSYVLAAVFFNGEGKGFNSSVDKANFKVK